MIVVENQLVPRMIKNLCSLRFLFMLPIVVAHLPFWTENAHVQSASDAAVGFFFMLSGFVLAQAYGQQVAEANFSLRRFLCRQLRKVYPIYLLGMLLFVCLNWNYVDWPQLGRIALACLMVQSWLPDSNYYFAGNGVSWFLSTLMFLYICFPLLQRLIGRLSVGQLMVGCVVLSGLYMAVVMQVPTVRANDIVYVNPLMRLPDFALGIGLHRFWTLKGHQVDTSRPWLMVFGVMVGYALFLAVSPLVDIRIRTASWYWAVNALTIFCFTAIDLQPALKKSLLHRPWMLWLGQKTYIIYLLHALLINFLVRLTLHLQPLFS